MSRTVIEWSHEVAAIEYVIGERDGIKIIVMDPDLSVRRVVEILDEKAGDSTITFAGPSSTWTRVSRSSRKRFNVAV